MGARFEALMDGLVASLDFRYTQVEFNFSPVQMRIVFLTFEHDYDFYTEKYNSKFKISFLCLFKQTSQFGLVLLYKQWQHGTIFETNWRQFTFPHLDSNSLE